MDLEKAQAYSLLKAQAYCILCRHSIQIAGQCPEQWAPSPSSWEADTICFFPNEPPQDTPESPVRAFRADLSHDEWFDPDGIGGGALPEWSIPKGFRDGLLKSSVNFSHVACLQLAERILGRPLRAPHLRDLTRYFRPILPCEVAPKFLSVTAVPRLPTSAEVSLVTELGRLLHGMSKQLPFELQQMILPGVDGLCRSLLATLNTLDSVKNIGLGTDAAASKAPSTLTVPHETVSVKLEYVDILGESCLAHLDPLPAHDDSTEAISTTHAEKSIGGVQVAFCAYAVADLRVLYSDRTYSTWKNSGRYQWFLNLECTDLSQLRLFSDGTKIVDITTSEPSPPNARLLWDKDQLPEPDTYSACINFRRYRDFILANGGYRLARYLPLEGMRSLTMFIDRYGVICIQINGNVKDRLGSPRGNSCAVTYHFREGESLEYLYMITSGTTTQPGLEGPAIVAITTTGRNLYYGNHHFSHRSGRLISDFELPEGSILKGLFTDAPSQNLLSLCSLGVTYQPIAQSDGEAEVQGYDDEFVVQNHGENGAQSHDDDDGDNRDENDVQIYDECESEEGSDYGPEAQSQDDSDLPTIFIPSSVQTAPSTLPSRRSSTIILSSTTFKDVQSLEIQRSGQRCIGLKITRHDKTIDTLGQWNPADHSHIHSLYETQRDGALLGLTFVLSEPAKDDDVFVQDIFLGVLQDNASNCFVWHQLDQELAWMFTQDYDHLMAYDVAFTEIRVPRDSVIPPVPVS